MQNWQGLSYRNGAHTKDWVSPGRSKKPGFIEHLIYEGTFLGTRDLVGSPGIDCPAGVYILCRNGGRGWKINTNK